MKIHHTRGVYPNVDFKDNGVHPEDLEHHIQYNKTMRPGRALFVDGVQVYAGIGVSEQILAAHAGVCLHFNRHTAPYH